MMFNVGDVVRLNSGGHPMTIDSIREEDQEADCVWIDDNGKPHKETYKLTSLAASKKSKYTLDNL